MAAPKIHPWNPSAEQQAAFRSTDATVDWLCHLPAELRRQHAGQWVAAKDCQVIAATDSFEQLLCELGDTDLQTIVIDRIERPAWMVYR